MYYLYETVESWPIENSADNYAEGVKWLQRAAEAN